MKRIVSLLMCVVMLCSMFAITVNAAENHFDTFHSEVQKLWFAVVFGGGEDNIYEFSPQQIKWVTNFKIDETQFDSYEKLIEQTYGDKTYSYTMLYYAIPANIYEAEAKKHFNISDINALRNDTLESPVYNAETHTYDMPNAGGMGDSITYVTKGYKDLGNGKYEVYGYTVEQAYEKPSDAVEGVDYIIMPEYGNAAEIVKCLKVTVEYNGTDVKFFSWETIALNEIPADEELVFACVHTPSSWITDKKATVNSNGEKHKECTQCGKILETETIAQLKCSKPSLKTISNTTSGVKVTWGKVSGADSYAVYRKTKGGSWKKLGDTKSTSYTDKTAKSGTAYYYTVRAENEVGLSSYNSTGLSIKRLANPKLSKKENTTSGVKITWGKVTGASGYIVYRKTSSGSWKEIGKTTKPYYTDKNAKSGTTYYYTVRAYSGSVKSYYDADGLKIKHLADPTLKTPSSTKSGVSLKWTKVTGAQGYIIYRKTGSGSYSKLKTEKGVSNLSYVDESARKGKKYTYKVKAYYSKTYSAYSNTKTITDKY